MQDRLLSTRRPRWLIAAALLLALFHLGGAWRVLQVPGDLAALVTLPMPLEFVASLAWAFAWGLVTLVLWRQHPRSRRVFGVLLGSFILYRLGWLAVFARADYDRQRLPFLVIAGLLLVIVVAAAVVRPTTIYSLTEKMLNGRKPQD